jgi:hypothetical protein
MPSTEVIKSIVISMQNSQPYITVQSFSVAANPRLNGLLDFGIGLGTSSFYMSVIK